MNKIKQKRKILFVYSEMGVGGSTTSLISLLRSFDYNNYDVELALFDRGYVQEKHIPAEVKVLPACRKYQYSITDKCKKAILFCICLLKMLIKRKQLNKKNIYTEFMVHYNSRIIPDKYDVVVGYLEGWSDSYVARCFHHCRKVMWIHTDVVENKEVNHKSMMYYLREADKIVCVSETLMNGMKETFPEYEDRIIWLPNILSQKYIIDRAEKDYPIETDLIEIERYKGRKIISVCRYSVYIKGIDRMIRIAKRLKEESISFRWYLVGDGPEREQVEKMVEMNDIRDSFIMLGEKENPYPYMIRCDVLALPSRAEGKPMVVTEAQMLGVIPIVTHYTSSGEQINHGVDGFIADNNEESYYQMLSWVLRDDKIILQLKEQIKEKDYSNMYDMKKYYQML